MDCGMIHHKYMSSNIRNKERILTSWYSVIKNKIYFSFLNGGIYNSTENIMQEVYPFIEGWRQQVKSAISEGKLQTADLQRFENESRQGLHDGLERAMTRQRRLVPVESLFGDRTGFVSFKTLLPAARQRCYVLLTKAYPPGTIDGVDGYMHDLARALAAQGHQVHVITEGHGHDRVDFEEGIWVHRIIPRELSAPPTADFDGNRIPAHIWDYSYTSFAEAEEIAGRRHIDCVCASIRDMGGIAFLREHRYPVVTYLQTAPHPSPEADPGYDNPKSVEAFVASMPALERYVMMESDGIIAGSAAVAEEIEKSLGFRMDPEKLSIVPHGLFDGNALSVKEPPPLSAGQIRLLLIGPLESDKGIDVLWDIMPELLGRFPHVRVDIVGDDHVKGADGRTRRNVFEDDPKIAAVRDRVVFYGEVNEARLRGFYRAADIILVPSRFESFGPAHLKGMMYEKPVIGCRAGGMVEVVDDGVTGLLAEPGDAVCLLSCIERLIESPELRRKMGESVRAAYLARFTADRMACQAARVFDSVGRKPTKC
jgi:glycogen(starch) synthase